MAASCAHDCPVSGKPYSLIALSAHGSRQMQALTRHAAPNPWEFRSGSEGGEMLRLMKSRAADGICFKWHIQG